MHINFVMTVSILAYTLATASEVCQWDEFKAECPSGHVIMMQHALYGRMDYGPCIKRDYGYVGCVNNVLAEMDLLCSGQRSCNVNVPHKLLVQRNSLSTKPCPEDLKMYLEANYTCQKVIEPAEKKCQEGVPSEVTSSSGEFASIVTQETGCGSTSSPWKIKVPAGQRINVTLVDFGRHNHNRSISSGEPASHCHVYAILKETTMGGQKSETICGGVSKERRSNIFTTCSNQLEIRLVTGKPSRDIGQFLIEYKAFGCLDLSSLPGVTWKRHGNKATLSCQGNNRPKWQLKCVDDEWQGHYENCTEDFGDHNSFSISVTALHHSMVTLSHSSSLIIIVAVALFIGLIILLAGLIIIRRRRLFAANSHRRQPLPQTYHPKDLPYNSKTMALECHPPLLSGHDPFVYSPEENEYAYVDEYQFQSQEVQSPSLKPIKSNDNQPSLNPYETTTRPAVPVPPPLKSCDRTGPGSVLSQPPQIRSHDRSHDPNVLKARDLPPQYFVLDPEALDEDALEDSGKGVRRDRSNEYT